MSEPGGRSAGLLALAERLGFTIHDADLFDRALTHASVATEPGDTRADYESLEFLGDAVLGLVVAHHLYATRPGLSPGEYSRLRASLVNRRAVARVGAALDLAPHIRLGKGEERSGGRGRDALLADCLEALIGALYLDSGWETARAFVVRVFHEELERVEISDQAWDYKSRLQNYCQSLQIGLPRFDVVRADGPDHRKEFEVEVFLRGTSAGRGRGHSKKEAEQNAAREALAIEGQLPPKA
jgi:ribonuclease-3